MNGTLRELIKILQEIVAEVIANDCDTVSNLESIGKQLKELEEKHIDETVNKDIIK